MKAKRDTEGKYLLRKPIRIDFSIGSSSHNMSHLKYNKSFESKGSSSTEPLHSLSNGHSYDERTQLNKPRDHHYNHRNDQDKNNYRPRFAPKRH